MTNQQLYLAIGAPLIMYALGFVIQHQQIAEINKKLGVMENDLRQFYRDLGRSEKAIEVLERKAQG